MHMCADGRQCRDNAQFSLGDRVRGARSGPMQITSPDSTGRYTGAKMENCFRTHIGRLL